MSTSTTPPHAPHTQATALSKAERARVSRRFERLSAGTGRLSFADFASTELGTPLFKSVWDVLTSGDPDAELSEADLVAALTGVARPASRADRCAFLFDVLDRNGDGRLDVRELAASLPRSVPDAGEAANAAMEAYAAEPENGLTVGEFGALLAAGEKGGRPS